MAYDLALSENGDLIFAANRDLQGASGQALLEQRMKLRMRIPRGQWLFDTDHNLGSKLYTLSGQAFAQAQRNAQMYVREALRDMNEITVDDVIVESTNNGRGLEVFVIYHINHGDGSEAPELSLNFTMSITVGE